MPILALQQHVNSLREGMNEIGKIKKGAPKKSDRPGEDLPYFRIVLNPLYQHLQPIVDELFTEQPEWFEGAHVLEDTADKSFSFWMEEWGQGGTLYHRCEGVDANGKPGQQYQWYTGAKYEFAQPGLAKMFCAHPACDCQRVGRLALMFEKFTAATGEFGYFTVYTSSKNDIAEVQKQLAVAEYMAARSGLSLIAVPFIFGRYYKAISSPAFKKEGGEWVRTDKRKMVDKSLFSLRTDPRWNVQTLLPALRTAALLPPPENGAQNELRIADVARTQGAARQLLGSGDRPRSIVPGYVPSAGNGHVFKPTEAEMEAPPELEDDNEQGPVPVVIDQTKQEQPPSDMLQENGHNEKSPDEPDEQRAFTSTRVKYIGGGNSAYVLFSGGEMEDPARLYGRDLIREKGENWKTFADALTPGPMTQEPVDLPGPMVVTAKHVVKDSGYDYWLVEQLTPLDTAPLAEAKAESEVQS